jgi:sarcosine oxidase subunit gamma
MTAATPLLQTHHFATQLNLRGKAENPAFAQAIQSATGLALPTAVNSVTMSESARLYCLGPDEWLFQTTENRPGLEAELLQSLSNEHVSIVDVSSALVTYRLQHPEAHTLLERGCPQDLHPRVFPSGQATQSHFAKANVLFLCLQAGTDFEITVRTSFAAYVKDWMEAATG